MIIILFSKRFVILATLASQILPPTHTHAFPRHSHIVDPPPAANLGSVGRVDGVLLFLVLCVLLVAPGSSLPPARNTPLSQQVLSTRVLASLG